jgi:hypothetical protein
MIIITKSCTSSFSKVTTKSTIGESIRMERGSARIVCSITCKYGTCELVCVYVRVCVSVGTCKYVCMYVCMCDVI